MSGDINEAKYDPADDDLVATDKDKASAKLNIVMQLRKSMDVRGNMAIKFADGKSQKIPMNIMKIALDKFAKVRKPDSKVKMQDAMSKSYKDMILTLKTFKETVWSNSLGREVLDEAAQILATGGKGQYKAVTKNGSVSIMFKGKAIATGDFDRGADAFFLSWKDMQKGKKNSRPEGTAFDTAQDMVDFFAKKKITESLDEATATTKQKKALTSLMTKALGGKKSKPGYTSSIASNGDFVAYDDSMRIQGRIKKGDFTDPMTEARQMKDPKKDSMVTKSGKTIVIDKSKESEYLKKGWTLAENETVKESNNFFKFRDSLNEKKDSAADLYFDTYSAAVQHAKAQAEKKGFEVVEDDWFTQVTTGKGKPGRGKTTRHTLKLLKNDKPVRKSLAIQVYNRDTNKNTYELNMYIS